VPATTAWEFRDLFGLAASPPVGLNRFGHIQIFMVAIYAKLQRIFEMAIGYVVKHNRLPWKRLLAGSTGKCKISDLFEELSLLV